MKLALSILIVVIVSGLASGLPSWLNHPPPPSVHDEFSYLLAADTFLHGRLTNPPLPHPEYFETFQELMRPSYASKYPPAQGMVLAAGSVLGHPIIGSIATMALACGAMVWMAAAVLSLRWSAWIGLIAATHPLLHIWATDYWGGNVATLAGALLLGAMLRAIRRPAWWHGVVAAIACGQLFNSRPLEGTIFAALTLIFLIRSRLSLGYLSMPTISLPDPCNHGRETKREGSIRSDALNAQRSLRFEEPLSPTLSPKYRGEGAIISPVKWHHGLRSALIAFLLVSIPIFTFDLYYNYRVTGSPFTFPYTLYAQQYQRAPLTFFQSAKPFNPSLDAHLSTYWNDYDYQEYERQTSLRGYINETLIGRTTSIVGFCFNPRPWLLALPMLAAAMRLKYRRVRWIFFLAAGLPLTLMILTPWQRMHYLAPAAGAFFLLLGLGISFIARFRWGGCIAIAILIFSICQCGRALAGEIANQRPLGWNRQHLLEQLGQLPGGQAVIVRYAGPTQLLFEWVFNSADLRSAKVIFARERGPQTLSDLRVLFPDRRFWMLTVRNTQYNLRDITLAETQLPSDNPGK